jgi:MFS family permease
MRQDPVLHGWRSLLNREWIPTLAVVLGGVLLQSTNVLMLTTVMPSIATEVGGIDMLAWPASAFLASCIVAASCAGLLTTVTGVRAAYFAGVITFGLGAVLCSLAPTMGWIVAGRFIQGFGGGLEVAVAYVVIRATFPEPLWARVIALMSTGWSVSVLTGPLVGGLFARFSSWRWAFVATAVSAAALAIGALLTLPSKAASLPSPAPRLPGARVALICIGIAAMSATSVTGSPVAIVILILASIAALAAMLQLDHRARRPLLPSDAFSWRTPTGVGLWLALWLCITYSPLQIYVPIFLQRIHGLDPLEAGFAVASASMGWTVIAIATAGMAAPWPNRLILSAPVVLGLCLLAIALLTPRPALLWWLMPPIFVLGVGMGQCWPFIAHRIMDGARIGDETVAASSVPTIQQMGFALGAAMAGLVANASGFADDSDAAMIRAALWIPAAFIVPAAIALVAAVRLCRLPTPSRLPPG